MDSIGREIERLKSLGWSDFSTDESGLRIVRQVDESSISFPSISWEAENSIQEHVGIWARYRASRILQAMSEVNSEVLWEVGSGHGNVAIPLRDLGHGVIAIEPLTSGACITAQLGIRTYLGTLESLRLPSESIRLVGVFDVLEHLEMPKELLLEIFRVLEPGGVLITTVPAHQWLFSDFDTSIGHFRRYSKKSLLKLLSESQFRENRANYLFSIFVFPALILRKLPTLLGRRRDTASTLGVVRKQNQNLLFLTRVLMPILRMESIFRLPFGLSLLSVSKK